MLGFGRNSPAALRSKALRSAAPGPLRDYLDVPPPDPATPADELRLLAVDLETTGLDPRCDQVLSVGWVPVDGRSIDLSGARRFVVRAGVEVGQSATVHRLTDDEVAAGMPLDEVLPRLLAALRGRVLLAHFTDIEEQFLSRACRERYGAPLPVARVDTLELQRRLIVGRGAAPMRIGLRLWTARERFGLPSYPAHDALQDALACAELYLGQVAELSARAPVTLRRLAS